MIKRIFVRIQPYLFSESVAQAELSSKPILARTAVGALLLSAALADGTFAQQELDLIIDACVTYLDLPRDRLQKFVRSEDAYAVLSESLSEINSSYSTEEKTKIVGLMWAVIGADRIVTVREGKFATHMREALGLSLEQAARASRLGQELVFSRDAAAAQINSWLLTEFQP